MSLYAKKSLGQNFLKSKKAIHTMINSVGTKSDSLIVEIGPGKGALTEPLLETGATVIAYELDERMIDFLKEKFSVAIDQEKLILRHADILEADITSDTNGKTYSVVANIPYYITGMIIRTLLSHKHPPEKMALLMQKEGVVKLCMLSLLDAGYSIGNIEAIDNMETVVSLIVFQRQNQLSVTGEFDPPTMALLGC